MIHLDTHVVVWLALGDLQRFPETMVQRFRDDALLISPIVELELAFLHEIGRLTAGPTAVLDGLRRSVDLEMDATPFALVSEQAASERFAFTRDPFDRVIGAQALCCGAPLATKDRTMLRHLDFAVWE